MQIAARLVGLVLVFAAGKAAAAPPWSVTPPPGWTDVSAATAQMPEIKKRRDGIAADHGTMEIVSYQSDAGDTFVAVFLRMVAKGDASMQMVRGFEAGAHDSSAKVGPDISYTTREDNNTLIADQAIKAPAGTVWLRRMAGANASDMLSLSTTCKGPEAVCAAALQSMTLDRTGFRPLASGPAAESSAYRAGYAFGKFAIPVIALLIVLSLLWRKRKQQSS